MQERCIFAKMGAFHVEKQEAMTPRLNGILYSTSVLSHTSSTASAKVNKNHIPLERQFDNWILGVNFWYPLKELAPTSETGLIFLRHHCVGRSWGSQVARVTGSTPGRGNDGATQPRSFHGHFSFHCEGTKDLILLKQIEKKLQTILAGWGLA